VAEAVMVVWMVVIRRTVLGLVRRPRAMARQLGERKNCVKKNGWTELLRSDGNSVQNQGDCVSLRRAGGNRHPVLSHRCATDAIRALRSTRPNRTAKGTWNTVTNPVSVDVTCSGLTDYPQPRRTSKHVSQLRQTRESPTTVPTSPDSLGVTSGTYTHTFGQTSAASYNRTS